MAFDFPNSPTKGQSVLGPNGGDYVWDGAKWTTFGGGASGGISEAPIDTFTYGRHAGVWSQVLPLAGGTMTGPLTLSGALSTASGIQDSGGSITSGWNGAGAAYFVLDTAVSNPRNITIQSNGSARIVIGTANAESGGNVGCDLYMNVLDDTGAYLHQPLLITRSTGAVKLTGPLGVQGATPIAKPTVTGSKSSNAALASLMTALAAYGLVTDSTT